MSAFFANRRGQSEAEAREPAPEVPSGRPVGFDTVIGSNTSFEGSFVSSGNVRMDGQFAGSLEISGNILVGESADIHADINARNISIAGTVRGNISGNKVQLLRTGRIWGDISAAALTTEEGAFIDGKITMVGHSATRPQTDDLNTEDETALDSIHEADEPADAMESELALEALESGDKPAEALADIDR